MIPKASQRGGGQQLATHLLNEFDNDSVEVADVRGSIAQDPHGAFAEWHAMASATRCRKYLYSLSVNPDPAQGKLTRDQYRDFFDRVEKKIGLQGQPRVLVFHVKHGREHCHAVYSRIVLEDLKAVQISHDRLSLRSVVREFARDHGLVLPEHIRKDGLQDRFNARAHLENLAEQQQEERTGISKDERMAAITEAWRSSDDAVSLIHALEERGYLLARGDQRAYVVVDRFGEIHSLPKQIEGVRKKHVDARLAGFPLEQLPDAHKAQEFARSQRLKEAQTLPKTVDEGSPRRALAEAHARRRAEVDQKRLALERIHATEVEALKEAQEQQERGVADARATGRRRGVLAFLQRITGIQALIAYKHRREDRGREQEQLQQRAALGRRHSREREDFRRHYDTLDALEARERRSLETALRREQFRIIARGHRPPQQPPGLTPTQQADLAAFNRNARDITEPPEPAQNENGTISPAFNEVADPKEQERREHQNGKTLSQEFSENADAAGPQETPADDPLRQALKERAERKARERERDGRDRDKGRDRNGGNKNGL